MKATSVRTYIGLGSNLGSPEIQLKNALLALAQLADCRLHCTSSFFTSLPLGGPPDQPDYMNAVVQLETTLSAENLLNGLQEIEQRQHRKRDVHWGPRTIDLDILLYSDQIITTQRLRIPHPEMSKRAFVLVPLAEIAGSQLEIPLLGKLEGLLKLCDLNGLQRLRNDCGSRPKPEE